MGCMNAKMLRVGAMTARMGMVCGSNLGAYEVMWVQEGPLMTVNGEFLLVKKKRKL